MPPNPQPPATDNQSLFGSNQPPYAGYGQRHDIFYQYQPPAPGSRPARPKFNPADLARKPAEIPKIDDTNPYETSNSHKGILITAALVLSCLAAIGVFFLVKQGGKAPTTNNSKSQNNGVTANPNVVSTLCYGFSLPLPHGAIPAENSCTGTYTTGSETITVNPILLSADLNGLVANWKQSNSNLQIVGETQFTLDNKSADGILYTNPADTTTSSNGNPVQTLSVLVFTGVNAYGAGYNIQGTPISGFEIKGAYSDQDTTKQSFDEVLSSWVWK